MEPRSSDPSGRLRFIFFLAFFLWRDVSLLIRVRAEEKRRFEKQLAQDAWEDIRAVLKEQ
jgi:hypothetical protein